jgi:hypothetical protein
MLHGKKRVSMLPSRVVNLSLFVTDCLLLNYKYKLYCVAGSAAMLKFGILTV